MGSQFDFTKGAFSEGLAEDVVTDGVGVATATLLG